MPFFNGYMLCIFVFLVQISLFAKSQGTVFWVKAGDVNNTAELYFHIENTNNKRLAWL